MPFLISLLRRRHWQHYRYLLRQVDIRLTLIRAVIYLTVVFALHSWIMVAVEGLAPDDAIWLTLTTVVTVGYGDYSAATNLGRLATVVLIYFGGVFVLFHVAADYFEYRAERRLAMVRGRWRWNMRDHVLLLNAPTINRDRYVLGFAGELRRAPGWEHIPILLLCRDYPDGLPDSYQEAGIVHTHGDATNPEDLRLAEAEQAKVLVVLAEHADEKRSDEITFDIIDRLQEVGTKGRILAECVRHANRERLRRAGADTLLRPVRFYPEIVVRAILSPGTEVILENLFSTKGDEFVGFAVDLREVRWLDVVLNIMRAGIGTAIGYAEPGGAVVCNPGPDARVTLERIYVLVKDHGVDRRRVAAALAPLQADAGRPAALALPD